MNLLCIGGPEHGRRVNVPAERARVVFPVLPDPDPRALWVRSFEPEALTETARYVVQKFYLAGRTIRFLCHEGTSPITAERLIFAWLADVLDGKEVPS